jgi:hypothetical protein
VVTRSARVFVLAYSKPELLEQDRSRTTRTVGSDSDCSRWQHKFTPNEIIKQS